MEELRLVAGPRQNVKLGDIVYKLIERQSALSVKERNKLLEESIEIVSHCIDGDFDTRTGLVYGYVQSGKTLSFTSVASIVKYNGFRVVIILAGTKLNLLNQTTERLKRDLLGGGYSREVKILQNPTSKDELAVARILRQGHEPLLLITVLKHPKRIQRVSELLTTPDVIVGLNDSKILIIDDEADQASLNTFERRNQKKGEEDRSATFEAILELRSAAAKHVFLQYTATPQGPLLLSLMNALSPDFHVLLSPGEKYTGGEVFFKRAQGRLLRIIPDGEVYHAKKNPLQEPPESLMDGMREFFVGAAIQMQLFGRNPPLSMMIHADVRRAASQRFCDWIQQIVNQWIDIHDLESSDLIRAEYEKTWSDLITKSIDVFDFEIETIDSILQRVYECFLDTSVHLVIGGEEEIDWDNSSCHILVGGPKLDRGFTVKGLMVTYMPRMSIGMSNADTIQQRCRFFGYKEDYLDSCRVYLPAEAIEEYNAYVDHESHLRTSLANTSASDFTRRFLLDKKLRPTRNNVLSYDLSRNTLSGSRQLTSVQDRRANWSILNNKLSAISNWDEERFNFGTGDRHHRVAEVPVEFALEMLLDFKVSTLNDVELKALTIDYLLWHMDNGQLDKCGLVQIAYDSKKFRERSMLDRNRVKNIFSGRSTSGESVYPGDKQIKCGDLFTIQIHMIRLKSDDFLDLDGQLTVALGLIYPKELSITFTTTVTQ